MGGKERKKVRERNDRTELAYKREKDGDGCFDSKVDKMLQKNSYVTHFSR